jgi:hypothetical protein
MTGSSLKPDEFEPGEMASLLADGEDSIACEGMLDADDTVAHRRKNRYQPEQRCDVRPRIFRSTD